MKAWLRRRAALALAVSFGVSAVGCTASPQAHPSPVPTATRTPEEVISLMQAELVPEEHSLTGYGPEFNQTGYETLLTWNQDLHPHVSWASDYEALDITIPCCGATHPFADESRNCGCGHHQALYGAGKYLLNAGYSREETQSEVDRWRSFFFPRETVLAELQRRAIDDPSLQQALDELEQRGGC